MTSRRMRKSERYSFSAPIDVSRNHEKCAFGSLKDISVDGIGFTARPALELGETYLVSIRGLAEFQCKIMHSGGIHHYGAQLILSDNRRRKLQTAIERYVEANGIKPLE